ncbi:MAG: methyltransferase [Bacteroidales bacterium]
MPVTTDSVLLGAWAFSGSHLRPNTPLDTLSGASPGSHPPPNTLQKATPGASQGTVPLGSNSTLKTVLDIGTGCGLLALMMAQRFPHAKIDAIEVDGPSAEEAEENVQSSPWKDRISVIHADFNTYNFPGTYQAIICNPPYFQQALESPRQRRSRARHSNPSGLTYQLLINGVSRILRDGGKWALVLPASAKAAFLKEALQNSIPLYPSRITYVVTDKKAPSDFQVVHHDTLSGLQDLQKVQTRAVSLVLLELTKKPITPRVDTLYLYDDNGADYHPQYRNLVRGFYLWA